MENTIEQFQDLVANVEEDVVVFVEVDEIIVEMV